MARIGLGISSDARSTVPLKHVKPIHGLGTLRRQSREADVLSRGGEGGGQCRLYRAQLSFGRLAFAD
jgi:hypothetical protein